ncbi:MAG: helix-turn-helix transcriptional regulator [Bdellovibrio sp.]|nr:helix-turn-helix transcriptional regulator [Bdellovibrio sp.]
MDVTHQKIAAMVREYREKAGMTQLELSTKLGYETPQFVSLFERGVSKIPLETMGQLVVILGIPEKKILDSLVDAYRVSTKEKMSNGKKIVSGG